MLRNHTLAALHAADQAALFPSLLARHVERGEVLTAQGAEVADVYFPASAYLANIVTFRDGRSAEAFVMGCEGVSGLAAFLAEEPCAWGVEVTAPGEVYQVSAAILRRQVAGSERLRALLVRRAYDYQAQAALAVACANTHTIPERLARLILASTARLEQPDLRVTQEDLARLIGVQRTSVNAAALILRKARAITYSRGVVRVTDRRALRQHACECVELEEALHRARPPHATHRSAVLA